MAERAATIHAPMDEMGRQSEEILCSKSIARVDRLSDAKRHMARFEHRLLRLAIMKFFCSAKPINPAFRFEGFF